MCVRLRPLFTTAWLWLALGLCAPLLAWAEGLPASVLRQLRQHEIPTTAVAVWVAPLDDAAQPRWQHRADAPHNPASVIKLLTTAAALEILGPQHQWQTELLREGPLAQGVLQGPLYVRGGGDPKLVLERLQAMLAQLRAAGVQRIAGDIVLDRSVFADEGPSPPFDDEPLRPYNVGADGLLLNFRSLILRFEPDPATGQARVLSEPPLQGLQVPATVPLRGGPCQDWRAALQADFRQPLAPQFAGAYPLACGVQQWPVAFALVDEYAPRVFEALWREAGGQLDGRVRWGRTPAGAQSLLRMPSLPLAEIVADVNKFSNNPMAQQVFLSLSAKPGEPARSEASRQRLLAWWQQRLPQASAPTLDNGSGLSRSQRISARSLAALLQAMHQSPQAQVFRDSLAVAGVDGTMQRLRDRLPGSPLIGRAWLKTGSLRDVASIAGYVRGSSGRHYVLVALIEHEAANRARPALDALLEATAQDEAPARRTARQ